MKKRISLLLVTALLASVFAGCGENASESSGNAQSEDSAVSSSGNSNFNETGYPVVNETVTYTAMFPNDRISGDPNEVMPIIQQLSEKTNVSFDWTIVSSDDLATRRALMLADGDIPDISFGIFDDNTVLEYGPQGVFLAFEDKIQQYMPNFYENAMTENVGVLDWLTLSDGHIYTLPTLGAPNMYVVDAQYINRSWLDELNLDTPTTTDELFDILLAFKEDDPNGNRQADEIPFAFDYASGGWNYGQFYSWFGCTKDWLIRDGVVRYSPYTENWKLLVQYLNKLNQNGLLDIELFTQDSSTFNAKAKEGLYGVLSTYTMATIGMSDQVRENYELMMPLDGGGDCYGVLRQRPEGNLVVLNKGVISAKAENPEILLRTMDVWYDPEYAIQVTNGCVGQTIDYDEDGNLIELPTPEGYGTRQEWVDSVHWNQFPCGNVYTEGRLALVNAAADRQEQIAMNKAYDGLWLNEVMPYNFQTVEENEAINKYFPDISKFVNETFAKWIAGEGDIDSEWDAYLAQLKDLHVEDMIAAYQAYYDRVCN